MIKKTLIFLLLSTQAYASQQSNIDAADAYWAKKQNHTSTSSVDSYISSHATQNTSSASSTASELGGAARSSYSNASNFGEMLNNNQSGSGGVIDLAGLSPTNTKATNYDICILNNPRNPELCATDKAASDAYKLCKKQNPSTWQTSCASMAGALASVNFISGCSNSKDYIKLSYVPSATTYDINMLMLEIDPSLSGSKTMVNPLPAPASGICINGIITCDVGTFVNCKYYKWIDAGGGLPGFQTIDNLSELGGCYCINKSCGGNLSLLNGPQILRDLSTGASSAILKSVGEGTQLTDTTTDTGNLTITVKAAKLSDCSGTANGSTPTVTTSDSSVDSLTDIAQRMTNENPTTDYLQEAGTSAKDAMENIDDPQGSEISAAGFLDPSTRATWKSNYQVNGNNYYKMMKNIDDITTSEYQDITCTVQRNFMISNPVYESNANGQTWVSTDHASTQSFTKSGDTYSLVFCGTQKDNKNLCSSGPGSQPLTSWTYTPQVGTTSTIGVDADTGTQTLTTNTTTLLGSYETISVNISADCNGAITFNQTELNTTKNYPQPCGASGTQSFFASWSYTFKSTLEVSSEGISNGCSSLETDSECQLKDEKDDGIGVMTNFMLTGLQPLPSCVTLSGQINPSYTVCRPWWKKEQTYQCTKTPTYTTDINDIVTRANSINQSTVFDSTTGNITFTDYAKDSSGNWQTGQKSDNLKISSTAPGACDMVCKTSTISTDTQVRTDYGSTIDTSDPTAPQRTGVNVLPTSGSSGSSASGQSSAVKKYSYVYCNPKNMANITTNTSDWTCPIKPDETIENDCSCPNEFGSSVGTVSALIEAGKNQKCSTGTSVTAQ